MKHKNNTKPLLLLHNSFNHSQNPHSHHCAGCVFALRIHTCAHSTHQRVMNSAKASTKPKSCKSMRIHFPIIFSFILFIFAMFVCCANVRKNHFSFCIAFSCFHRVWTTWSAQFQTFFHNSQQQTPVLHTKHLHALLVCVCSIKVSFCWSGFLLPACD